MQKYRGSSKPGRINRLTFVPALRVPGGNQPVTAGKLRAGSLLIPCVIGRSGTTREKREGDGKTPCGTFRILNGYFRSGRSARPFARIRIRATAQADGWCDAPGHAAYNRPVKLPFAGRHEQLWRADGLYDYVLVLDYNFSRRAQYKGSAIFLHLWRDDKTPTEGCLGIAASHMQKLLPRLAQNAILEIP